MITIMVGDITSQIEHPENHPVELVKLREICRARPENFMFMPNTRQACGTVISLCCMALPPSQLDY